MVRSLPSAAPVKATTTRYFYSTSVEGELPNLLGRPHYSYRFAQEKFLSCFAKAGVAPQFLRMPEYYATRAALAGDSDAEPGAPMVHLIFRSTEHIRVLHPGYNIACYAWEFEVLKDWTASGEQPLLNQKRMLSLCEEVWVPCRFTRDVLTRHGLTNVHVIPAPLDVPTRPRLSRTDALATIGHVGVMPLRHNFLLSGAENARAAADQARSLIDWLGPRLGRETRPIVYLAVLNPDDFRKNVDAMVRGFHYFQQTHPRAVLLVKALTSPGRRPLDRIVAELVPNKLDSGSVFDTDAIAFFAQFLSAEEMGALYCLADFYVSTSMAEGQNLPLLEAMAEGTVPISTTNTAMSDYIRPDNAFCITSRRVPAPNEHFAGGIAGRPYCVDLCGPRDVYAALNQAAACRPNELRGKAVAASQTVREQFSYKAIWPMIKARLDKVVAQ